MLPLIMLAQFVFTVAYLHDVAHGSAGLSAGQTHYFLFVYGVLMLQSGHAFRNTHLFHHTHCLEEEDLEGAPARMKLIDVLLAGPAYLPRLWHKALREAGARERRCRDRPPTATPLSTGGVHAALADPHSRSPHARRRL